MRKFFKELLSSRSGTSSKRFAALFTLINLIILAYVATFAAPDKIVPKFIYDALVIIVAGGLGLTVLEKIWGKGDTKIEPEPEPEIEPEPEPEIEPEPCNCKCHCKDKE